jgi:hypothetical protein
VSSRPRRRARRGYADSVAIIVIAAILVMIAVVYGLTQLGRIQSAPLASPSFPPQSESPSPSPSPTISATPNSSPTSMPLPSMSPDSNH